MKLTWSKQPSEQGLASVGQGPRGAILKVDGKRIGTVSAVSIGWKSWRGWFWSTPPDDDLGIPWHNSHETPSFDLDAAKAECEAYVRKCLGLPEKKKR